MDSKVQSKSTAKSLKERAKPGRRKASCLKDLLAFDAELRVHWLSAASSNLSSDITTEQSAEIIWPFRAIVGLDEVGRGSAIGPVIAGAVSLPEKLSASEKKLLHWLNDSKKLLPAVRAELAEAIHAFCRVGIGEATKDEVDSLNVHHASLLAIERAYAQWAIQPSLACEERTVAQTVQPVEPDDYLILDGRALLPRRPRHRQQAIIKGDGKSASIAAASVVAKQYRDAMIIQLAEAFPGYGWETNIGYQTPQRQPQRQRCPGGSAES